jgi:probable O-glycosylation ligase (exosortase A-associated)
MRSLFITAIYCSFFIYGLRAPFVFLLGYVWVDIFTPQLVAYTILPSVPVSFLIGVATLASIFFIPKNRPFRLPTLSTLIIIFGIYMTLSLLWAVVPDLAYEKWDRAIKSILIASLIPLILRGRIEIEAFVWVIVLAGMAHCIPFGIKVLIDGGGYGQAKGLVAGNSGYGEGSTLAMFAVSLVPFMLFLLKNSTIIPSGRLLKIPLMSFVFLAFLTSLGTFARTGLVSAAVLGISLFYYAKRKIVYGLVAFVVTLALAGIMGANWSQRMSTIGDSSEGSAMGRVAVWMWTLDYVSTHPFGGGFGVNSINEFTLPLENGTQLTVKGKAAHSVYFEILGELGYPGLFLFLLIIINVFIAHAKISKIGKLHDDQWTQDLSKAIIQSLLVFLAGGAFIGIAFQSYFYYLAALAASLLVVSQAAYQTNGQASLVTSH